MDFPETWGTLLLKLPPDPLAAFAERLQATCGVAASPTDQGWLQLPGGFLAQLDPRPYPRDLLAHPAAPESPVDLGVCQLHLTGGGFETDNLALRLRGEAVPRLEPVKSSRFQKLERFTELVSKLLPLAHGCVLPMSGFRWISDSNWPKTFGAGEVFSTFLTLANCAPLLHTRGLRNFALPEVACALPPGADAHTFQAATRWFFDCVFELAWQGFLPAAPATLHAVVDKAVSPCEVRPLSASCLWISSPADTADATREWLCRSHVGAALKAQYVFDDPAARRGHVSVAAFATLSGSRVFATSGLHLHPRHGGSPVELIAFPSAFHPSVPQVLAFVSDVFLTSPNPVRPWDRLVMPGFESKGFAGVVLCPAGHVNTSEGKVETWDALPFTPAELQSFRAGGQQAWLDRIFDSNAFPELHARWTLLKG